MKEKEVDKKIEKELKKIKEQLLFNQKKISILEKENAKIKKTINKVIHELTRIGIKGSGY